MYLLGINAITNCSANCTVVLFTPVQRKKNTSCYMTENATETPPTVRHTRTHKHESGIDLFLQLLTRKQNVELFL